MHSWGIYGDESSTGTKLTVKGKHVTTETFVENAFKNGYWVKLSIKSFFGCSLHEGEGSYVRIGVGVWNASMAA